MKIQSAPKGLANTLTFIMGMSLYSFSALAQGTGFISPTDNPGRIQAATGGQGSARSLILTIVNFFLGFLGLISVLMIIWGGLLYITAAGDPAKAGKGKTVLIYSAVGIVIILISFAFVNTILGAGTGQGS